EAHEQVQERRVDQRGSDQGPPVVEERDRGAQGQQGDQVEVAPAQRAAEVEQDRQEERAERESDQLYLERRGPGAAGRRPRGRAGLEDVPGAVLDEHLGLAPVRLVVYDDPQAEVADVGPPPRRRLARVESEYLRLAIGDGDRLPRAPPEVGWRGRLARWRAQARRGGGR